ncbi:TerD family protein [Nocardia caishijiensis]|uniref:Stress response protein SCP2 n=1 Tax=Nocardia caishijiensis TaxID=184756 RepID=A0ABQ6YUB6_9NOCA|nr:TerD family protein [Nocardia caishijiensis]KAF0849398.1 stress response protein SCP2 [Nocardia caishijiensis]
MIHLKAGQNTALTADAVRFTAQTTGTVELGALVVGEDLRVRDEHDHVCASRPSAPGVRFDGGSVELALSQVRSDAHAVLLFVAAGHVLAPVTASLAENGVPAAEFVIAPTAGESSLICLEVYRRGTGWKLRALGQGYAGGAAQLLSTHGVPNRSGSGPAAFGDHTADGAQSGGFAQGASLGGTGQGSVAGAAQGGAPGSAYGGGSGHGVGQGGLAGSGAPGVGAQGGAAHQGGSVPVSPGYGTAASAGQGSGAGVPTESHTQPTPSPGIPLEVDHGLQRMWMIFEDAARSAAALVSARDYAAKRLDQELSEAVSNPATRNTPAADAARQAAQRRHDELVATADADHRRDSDMLAREIAEADAVMPAALASWLAPAWTTRAAASDGIRLGELYAPDRGDLRVPYCVPVPLNRPLWVETESSAAASRVVGALLARLVAAIPERPTRIDLIDLTGGLRGLATPLSPLLAGPVIADHLDISPRLAELANAAELAEIAYHAGEVAPPREHRILVAADFPHGYQAADVVRLGQLMVRGDLIGLSLLIVGTATPDAADAPATLLSQSCRHLPTLPGTPLFDPWTGNAWELDLDMLPLEPELQARYLRM